MGLMRERRISLLQNKENKDVLDFDAFTALACIGVVLFFLKKIPRSMERNT